MKIRSTLLLLMSLTIPTLGIAAQNIDVLLVYSDDINKSSSEKLQIAARYQNAIGQVFGDPILPGQLQGGDKTIEIWPLISPEMSINASQKSGTEILEWMEDENANIASALRIGRETLGNPGADLVVMVVPGTTEVDSCGATNSIPLVVSASRSESHAFAYLVLQDNLPDCEEEIVVPHEIGHLLYAEHQYDTNGDSLLPSYKNHAKDSSAIRSLMWDVTSLNSNNTNYLSGSLSTITSSFANNVDFISNDSFLVVGQYRAPPPVEDAFFCTVEYNGCVSNSEEWLVTHSANYNMAETFLERSNNGGTTWWPTTTGGLVCVPQQVSGTSLFRIFGITIAGALTDHCYVTVYGGTDCEDNEAW